MTKKLVWRLSKAPTVEELKTAVEAGIISKEEAKEMLVRNEEEIPTDQLKEVKDEMKLLRDLVLALSSKQSNFYPIVVKEVEIIKQRPYVNTWIDPYITWCSSTGNADYKFTTASSKLDC